MRTILAVMLMTSWTGAIMAQSVLGRDERINLVDFARVVHYQGNTPQTLQVQALERGPDGWEAWTITEGPHAGQYAIGVEWDEPRDIAVVNIEFRHAIAGRHEIRAQYFHNHWPHNGQGGWARLDDPFHGRWITAQGEWWAGDRDVSYQFGPYAAEHPDDADAPDLNYRRTYRLRFLLGEKEPPSVRYIRAYGPGTHQEAEFEVRLEDKPRLKPPVEATLVNGYFIDAGTNETRQTLRLENEPLKFRVRFFSDGLESSTRTIVTLRDARDRWSGFSFLPAEALRYRTLPAPTLGLEVRHLAEGETAEPEAPPSAQVYDRVSREPQQTWERARREIPVLKKSEQHPEPLYLPLGPPLSRQEIGIRYDGALYLSKEALKAPAADSERLHWPDHRWHLVLDVGDPPCDLRKEGAVRQRLLENTLPIVVNTWEHEGIHYEQTSVATWLMDDPPEPRGDETVVMLVRLELTNAADETRNARVALRMEPGESFEIDGAHVFGAGKLTDNGLERYDQPRYRFHLAASDNGITFRYADSGTRPQAALQADFTLEAGEKRTIHYAVPFVTLSEPREREAIAGLEFERILQHEAKRWRDIMDQAAVLEVPDQLLNDFYRAQIAHVLITGDRDPFNGTEILPAATYLYNVCLNESCHQIRSLEIRGLHDQAARFLDAAIRGQSSRKMRGRFQGQKGVFHGLPTRHGDYQTFNYNLDHGFVLWMLNEHYRLTRDRRWLASVAQPIVEGCDFIIRERDVPPEANTLAEDDTYWGHGLLPPGHLEDPPEWLWWYAVNAYAYRGLRDSAQSLADIDHPEAPRLAVEAEKYGRHLRQSCKESMIRAPIVRMRDGTWIPHQPTRSRLRGRDLGWIRDALYGPVHLIDCGVYDADSPEAEWILRDAEDNVFIGEDRGRKLEDFERQWFSWGGITLQSNLLPNTLVYLQRRQHDHAVRAFYNSLAANVYEDVRTFTEHPIRAYGIGQGPFFKSPDESGFIVWLRHLLIAEDGDDLRLMAGVPDAWVAPGRQMRVQDAPTWFGPMSMLVNAHDDRIQIDLEAPTRNPPDTIHLRVPAPAPLQSVRVNDRPVASFDPESGWITLEPGDRPEARLRIIVRF